MSFKQWTQIPARVLSIACVTLAGLLAASAALAQNASMPNPPQFITFGAGARLGEGDPDHGQAFYFSVPATAKQPLFIRLFDPEVGGAYDQIASPGPNTTTRYTIYGGEGADTGRFARPDRLSYHERTIGTKVLQKEFRTELDTDNVWVSIGSVQPEQGDLVNGRYVFRLVVEGMRGNDGNVFDFAISASETANIAPEGLEILSYSPTTRTPVDGIFSELRFRIPGDAQSLNLGSFDAANAKMFFTQRFQSFPIDPSEQNAWKATKVLLGVEDRGTEAAITLMGGDEIPNDATYYVTDQSGRVIPFVLPIWVATPNERPIPVAIAQEPQSCMAVSFDGSNSRDPEGEPLRYHWYFGDGQSAAGAKVSHTYDVEGRMTAWLEVDDDYPQLSNGGAIPVGIFVKRPPIPRSTSRKLVAANEDVSFDGTASTASKWEIARHEWRVSDGTVLEGAVVKHAFRAPGTYKVTHIVEDNSANRCNTASEEFSIRVNLPPVAVAGPEQLVTASVVQFDGSASNDTDGDTVARYEWDFGDGGKATGQQPSHVYAKPGTYEVKLTVADSSGTIRNTGSNTTRVVINARPIADAGPSQVGAPGQTLQFDGSRSVDPDGSVAEYRWDFRDGATATGASVSHAFAKPGIYKVLLRVKDNTGHEEAIDFGDAEVFINQPPVAVAGPDVVAAPGDEVKLSGGRSFDPDGKIASYRWDFSDRGEPMHGAEVARIFDKPGIYTAKLTVTDDSGAINATASAELRIAINHMPVANAGDKVETNQTTIDFDAGKSVDADGDPLTYAWDFGDGTRATGARVTHTYADGGTYPVVLLVDDGKGLRNSTNRHAVSVRIDRPPVAAAGENKNACTGDVLVFDGSKSSDPEGGVLRYLWDFGDGTKAEIVNPTKSYRQGGLYPVTLSVRDDSGLPNNAHTSRIAVRIDQGPVANVSPRQILACANNEVSFDGSKSTDVDGVVNNFRWDFGDGFFGGGERQTHIYEKPGKYRAFLTITGEKVGNCSNSSTDEVAVEIIAGPVAVIKALDAVPVTDTAAFDGSASKVSDGKITGWRWDFGDGSTATGAQVQHKYAKAGTYRVSLTITSDSASPTCRAVSSRHVITVNDPPEAKAQAKTHVAVDEEVVLDATESRDPDGAIVRYEWDFGDGTNGTGVTARHKYREPGSYKARLAVHDNAGLANSIAATELTVKVNAPPVPVISGPEVACVGERITWTSERSSDLDGKISAYRWSFGDGNEAAAASGVHAYKNPGRYSMTLFADDGTGLANSRRHVTRSIWVNQPPVASPGADQTVCPVQTVRFDGRLSSDPDGKLTRYQWDFGDGQTREGAEVEHQFAEPGTYQVRLTVTDDSGSTCATNTAALKVLVKAPPVANAGGDREIWVGGANDAILLDGSRSKDPDGHALTFTWQIGDGTSTAGERVRHVIAQPGEYKSVLTVADTSGLSCGSASDSFRIIARERK